MRSLFFFFFLLSFICRFHKKKRTRKTKGTAKSTYYVVDGNVGDFVHGEGKDVVAAALLLGAQVVLVADAGVLAGELLHGGLAHDVAGAAVAEAKVVHHGDAAEVVLAGRLELAQPLDEVGPQDVGVGVHKDVPVVAGLHLVRLLGHVHVLVFVEAPPFLAGIAQLVAVVLVDHAPLLAAVEIEVYVAVLGRGEDRLEAVVDVVAGDVLLQVAEEEEVGQALEHRHELRGDLAEGLAGARLHDEQDAARVGEAVAEGVPVRAGGEVVVERPRYRGALVVGTVVG